MRRAHILKKNHTSETWTDLLFFDTETHTHQRSDGVKELSFVLGWCCYVRVDARAEEWSECLSRDDLYRFVLSKCLSKRRLVVLAHNLYFDLRVSGLLVRLLRDAWTMKRLYVAESGVQSFFLLRKGDKSILLMDTMNIYNTSVKKLGELFGYPKGVVDFEATDYDALSAYCARDVYIIKEAFLSWLLFLKRQDLGCVQKTLASQAFSSYRHRFMTHPIAIHTNARAIVLERASYFGGRVENYRVGKLPYEVTKLDINSMYPSVMRSQLFPVKLVRYYNEELNGAKILSLPPFLGCIADVTLSTDIPRYPYRTPDRVIYPVGSFRTTLCHASLRAAIEAGHVRVIHQAALYACEPIFTDFVDYFWAQRSKAQAEQDEARSYLFKILMNSLYGKFGQRGYEQKILSQDVIESPHVERAVVNGRYATLWRVGNKVIVSYQQDQHHAPSDIQGELTDEEADRVVSKEGYNSFTAIASFVTDYARDVLWRLMEHAGREHVYYVDTDCLVVDAIGRERLHNHIGKGLGQLKDEGTVSHAVFYAPKDYEWGADIKRKGVRPNAQQGEQPGMFHVEQWERWRTGLRQGMETPYRIFTRTKVLSRTISHGVVRANGAVAPFVLSL